MKRKLDDNDIPAEVSTSNAEQKPSFEALNLDPRLLQAVTKEQYSEPTPIQAEAIPLALDGKDILARAKTGSGKTAAYALPVLHLILQKKASSLQAKSTSALVLVPTRELAEQVHKAFSTYSAYCLKEIRCVNITQKVSDSVLSALLADSPDIVITTPARATQNVNNGSLVLENLTHLIIDEADLVLSYGYEEDMESLASIIPKGVQTLLMSATLTSEINTLKGLFSKNPAILNLEDKDEGVESVKQYVVKCSEDEKFLLTYVIFKLQLVKGKCIIFVADVDRSYRLKLFLEQFGIKSCVLNSELPVNSRIHVVQQFNKNIYDIIIAADDQEVLGGMVNKHKGTSEIEAINMGDSEAEDDLPNKKKRQLSNKNKDYGISRGIDFANVACVLNFDLPTSSKSYTHRIGRTARAGKTGMALSFVIPAELHGKHKPTSIPTTKNDEKVLDKIAKHQHKKGKEVHPYHFDMGQVDSFRYRMNDALRAVTSTAIREARSRELKQELLKSEKLKRHFEENPEDLRHLRHDHEVRSARLQPHLKHIPDYLMPSKGKKGLSTDEVGFVGMRKTGDNKMRKGKSHGRFRGKTKKVVGRRTDPLKTFSSRRS